VERIMKAAAALVHDTGALRRAATFMRCVRYLTHWCGANESALVGSLYQLFECRWRNLKND